MLALLILVTSLVSTLGHMCLLAPYQRPGYVNAASLTKPGSAECGLTDEPCGGVPNGQNQNAAIMSEKLTVVMLKNFDYFYAKAPGNFTVSLWTNGGEKLRDLGFVADDARKNGSIYQVPVLIPHEGTESKFIIQAAYFTNNPSAPEAFYQCADLEIYPRD
eukprot:423076_1